MLNKIKDRIKKAFYFSNAESNGLFAIMLLILLLIIVPKVGKLYYRFFNKPLDHNVEIALLEKNLRLLQANASKVARIDINRATVQQLQEIEGITEPLAKRIIRYRDKLGGFISLDQYKEVYALSNYLRIRLVKRTTILASYRPKQLSINQATFKELVAHPYIAAAIAKAIIDYRKSKGKFTTLSAMQILLGHHPDGAKKIMPYLTL